MNDPSPQPQCQRHPDRPGLPCPRCGTFNCLECLSGVACERCLALKGERPVQSEDVHGFGRRAGGRIIDLVTHQVLAVVAGVIAGITIAILESIGVVAAGSVQSMGKHGFLFNMLAGSLASLAGSATSTVICGASVGKAILGMRVVRLDGSRPGLGASLVRELGYFIDVFFFGLVAKAAMDGSSLAQRHGDRWAGTAVVRADHAGGTGRPSGVRLAVGLMAGAFVYALAIGGAFVLAVLS
ncbi:MAG: RDD family protein [Myxococcaceae bacterium]|nr:RDD family protein [Myxococcaceae bacterium]